MEFDIPYFHFGVQNKLPTLRPNFYLGKWKTLKTEKLKTEKLKTELKPEPKTETMDEA